MDSNGAVSHMSNNHLSNKNNSKITSWNSVSSEEFNFWLKKE
jgi:hypothetical protein